jgi:hypothetical protein
MSQEIQTQAGPETNTSVPSFYLFYLFCVGKGLKLGLAQGGLKLSILLPLPSQCWDYRQCVQFLELAL